MAENNRYHRQIILKEFGESAQVKLKQAKVLVIGSGGLGCPALQYLAAAGIGTIGIVDFDLVDLSNLQRQTLYSMKDIGKPKALVAAFKLNDSNPEINVVPYTFKLTKEKALELFPFYDIIMDGTDNFSSRYLINDACVILNKPLIYGAVLRFEGQVGVFNMADKQSGIKTNYRDMFPEPPEATSVMSCKEAGVLGVLPGIIGVMQATEIIKIISGVGKPLCNKIISYNSLHNSFHDFEIYPSTIATNNYPKDEAEFLNFDYDWFCGACSNVKEITVDQFDSMRKNEKVMIIDVREKGEHPLITEFDYVNIPLNEFQKSMSGISTENKIVIFCKSGKRSATAVSMLNEAFPQCDVCSLVEGIENWKMINQ